MRKGGLWAQRSQRDFPGGRPCKAGDGGTLLSDSRIKYMYLRFCTLSGAALCMDTAV